MHEAGAGNRGAYREDRKVEKSVKEILQNEHRKA
jgi:hypothetical protein